MLHFKDIYILFILVSFIASLKSFRLDYPLPYKHFSLFLLYAFLNEITSLFLIRVIQVQSNMWLINVYIFMSVLFYSYFYSQFITSKKPLFAIKILSFIYIIFSLINITVIQGFNAFNSYSFLIGCVLVIYLTGLYFRQIIISKELVSLSKDPLFWISAGIFIFHLSELPYLVLLNYLNEIARALSKQLILVLKFLNVVMYTLITIGFLCRTSIRKS